MIEQKDTVTSQLNEVKKELEQTLLKKKELETALSEAETQITTHEKRIHELEEALRVRSQMNSVTRN